jgi:SAM-dependent methyltransferase
MTERFDPDWLALREDFDAESRSRALSRRLLDVLPERPHLLDLGAGTGSLFRFLAPLIKRSQFWVFVDADTDLLAEAFRATADWAKARGWTVAWPRGALLIDTPTGAWRIDGLARDLADAPAGLPLAHTDAVLCSALLDLVSASWVERLVAALHAPFFAGLSVDGRHAWLPRHPADAIIAAGFRRDQHRNKGFGCALGVHAPSFAMRAFAARGFAVTSAPADWRVPRTARRMTRALVRDAADGARAALPARHIAIAVWEAARMRQAMQGRLAIRVGHRDLLALPEGPRPADRQAAAGRPSVRSTTASTPPACEQSRNAQTVDCAPARRSPYRSP